MSVEELQMIWPEWQIEGKPLGKGSFGVVYKAVRRDYVKSYAAIKMISIPIDSSEVDTLRSEGLSINDIKTYFDNVEKDFIGEIQLLESLKGNPNIVSIEDYKVVEKKEGIGWNIYIRMELLTPFNAYICDKQMDEKEVIKLGCDICTALEICEKKNIIHRDIKPENIFINDCGCFKLGDFGIARKMENMTSGLSMRKGTINYMAPEVVNSNEYDARVDTYSLGIVLYRLLNENRLPFIDCEKQLLNPNEKVNAAERRIRGEALNSPCKASKKMSDLILRACAYEPYRRFGSAGEMKQALMKIIDNTYYYIEEKDLDRTISVRKVPDNNKIIDKEAGLQETNVESDTLKGIEKITFDYQRYSKESRGENFRLGHACLYNEYFVSAKNYFNKAYSHGNVLAGVLLGTIYYKGLGGEKKYDKAIPLFINGMENGCPLGAYWLAWAYLKGCGVPQDMNKANELFLSCKDGLESMCTSGVSDAQYAYGIALLDDFFQSKDEEKGMDWLKKAMYAGNVDAGVRVAQAYLYGWGIEKNTHKGLKILFSYINSENMRAQYELGKVYFYGELVEKNYKKALTHFRKAARQGHATSQCIMGYFYHYGLEQEIQVDYGQAIKWYNLSERQENQHASYRLGLIYYYGNGIPVDRDKAFEYFKNSSDKGNDCAQYMLHHFYFFDDKYKNYELGQKYLEKSAKQGNPEAQTLLARCYLGSFDFTEEDEKFVYWLKKAAEQDYPEAQRLLGWAYIELENNKVLPKSYHDAIEWLEKAVNKGDIIANIYLAEIYFVVEEYKDSRKATYYLECVEQLMKEEKQSGNFLRDEYYALAHLYFKIGNDSNSFIIYRDNMQKAIDNYYRAYLLGSEKALYPLGVLYFIDGFPIFPTEDPVCSNDELLQKIIFVEKNSTSPDLASLLGKIYFKGYRVSENKAEAEKWYLIAIKKGDKEAACELALYYINERKLYKKGFDILEGAYETGSIKATRLLGLCYKNSIGVRKNRTKAKALLKEAANKGDKEAAGELKHFLF